MANLSEIRLSRRGFLQAVGVGTLLALESLPDTFNRIEAIGALQPTDSPAYHATTLYSPDALEKTFEIGFGDSNEQSLGTPAIEILVNDVNARLGKNWRFAMAAFGGATPEDFNSQLKKPYVQDAFDNEKNININISFTGNLAIRRFYQEPHAQEKLNELLHNPSPEAFDDLSIQTVNSMQSLRRDTMEVLKIFKNLYDQGVNIRRISMQTLPNYQNIREILIALPTKNGEFDVFNQKIPQTFYSKLFGHAFPVIVNNTLVTAIDDFYQEVGDAPPFDLLLMNNFPLSGPGDLDILE